MNHRTGLDRSQVLVLPEALEDYIAPDNPVRFIEAFVASLDLFGLGFPKAITAMAHKLARILWHLLKHKEPYDPKVWASAEEKLKKKRLRHLQQTAAALGYQLVVTA